MYSSKGQRRCGRAGTCQRWGAVQFSILDFNGGYTFSCYSHYAVLMLYFTITNF